MKKILGILIILFLTMALVKGVSARCEQQYGGGETCYEGELRLDKVVKNPSSGTYVDNLYSSDPNFSADQEVWFKLNIKNTGSDDLNDIEVKDKFPNYILFVSGPGSWNDSDKTLSWKIDHLSPGESKDYEIKGKIVGEGSLPSDSGTYCVTNYGEAKKDNKSASDTSQLCITKKVLGITTMPKTGANLIWFLTLPILLNFVLIFGFKIHKKFN
ncbi:DUF11 domain-containing protein [Patescibacteria group bacterium]|nr:DUF11 domain-containing protein [Patescibacteria group bacterium]